MSNEHSAGKEANLVKALEYLRANKHWLKSDLERTIALNVCMGILEQQLSKEPQQTGWVSVEERLPEISEVVLVETHHFDNSNGNRVLIIETFVGYMDEYGDLYSKPTDDNYGWQFNDVVKRWQPLPAPPQQTIHSPENKEK
jgi:hypothetical protein